MFTIETLRVSIADSCTFHLNITCRNATNHCPRASIPLQHGSRGLQRHYSPLKDIVCKLRYIVANILWRNDQTISITIKYAPLSYRTGGNRKRFEQSMNAVHKSLETVFSIAICRQSGRQTAIKNSVFNDLRSTFVDSINIFDCHLKCLLNTGLLNTQPNQSKTMATRNNLLSGYKRQSKTLFLMI